MKTADFEAKNKTGGGTDAAPKGFVFILRVLSPTGGKSAEAFHQLP